MRSRRMTRLAGIGAAVLMTAAVAQAQPEDKRTYFTFNRPIALPGATLPAGRYLFRIVDSQTGRKVVQVLSNDGKTPVAMLNTITDERSEAAKDPEVSFIETRRDAPSAVKTWWYPGERTGYEFIYPRAQARALARSTGASVLTTKADTTKAEETRAGDLTHIDSTGRDQDAAAAADNNARQTGQVAQDATPPASSSQRNEFPNPPQVARNTLPRTASQLPFVGIVGML